MKSTLFLYSETQDFIQSAVIGGIKIAPCMSGYSPKADVL